METQEVHAGRSVQRRRDIPRSGHNGTGHAGGRRAGRVRHGRPVVTADLAVQPAIRQTYRRLAASTLSRDKWETGERGTEMAPARHN